ncbi:hypothetical protein B0T11DRAFT_269870 [Plectosphaerella cucumerina]|uniref:Uncharacterized protein n=1 Tax=Plectosphaerella cucumerina TaxID=40658 RepID=A0A8K0X8C0_9PEZI|nr:hypothetical protein B0T11DRAFT_269870 [Plectosphaerella cucumerina]
MHFLFLAVFPVAALAALNGRCTGDQATGLWKADGICLTTTTCSNRGGKTKDGACPNDGNNIKCCVINESRNPCGVSSYCTWASNPCFLSGRRLTGFCPGPDNYSCCQYDGEKS